MSLSWRQKRKSIFIVIIIILVLAYSAYKIYPYFNVPPNCFDNKQNGNEFGVDCGGSCEKICPTQVTPFNIKFAKAIESEKGLYDIVALVENKNGDKTTVDGSIDFSFNIYNKYGLLIKTVSGKTMLPIGQTFPVIVQNVSIDLGDSGNAVGDVVLKVQDNKSWSVTNSLFANNFFEAVDTNFEQNKNNISQLTVNLKNLTNGNFRDLPVRVLLYDKNNNLIAINETILRESKAKSTQDLIFTWRVPLLESDPRVEVYQIVTPFTSIK